MRRNGIQPFSRLPHRIVFTSVFSEARDAIFVFAPRVFKATLSFVIVAGLLASGVNAPISQSSLAANGIQDERKQLEDELRQVEQQIGEYESTISDLKSQASTLKNELKRLDVQIAQINLRIKATNLSLEKLNSEILETQNQIAVTESDIEFQKQALAQTLRTIYQEESASLVEILMRNPKFSDFFVELNSLLVIQDATRQALNQITDLKNKLLDQKETLSFERADVLALKELNEAQQVALKSTRGDKDRLLKVTAGKETQYQGLLKESQKAAADIRNRIFQLLGGGELTFENALDLAKLAESATGVRAAFILAILTRESALGKYVGSCPYYDPAKNRYYMHPTRDVPVFLKITKELNLDPNDVKVSCPNTDGAYGGAMGPAQFIPSTWAIYASAVTAYGGGNPPSPWNNRDAFLATAIYLKELGADKGIVSAEREAAARYYAGGRWRRFLWTYGDWVVSKASSYQKDINILEG